LSGEKNEKKKTSAKNTELEKSIGDFGLVVGAGEELDLGKAAYFFRNVAVASALRNGWAPTSRLGTKRYITMSFNTLYRDFVHL
jgi:hypothetical protein